MKKKTSPKPEKFPRQRFFKRLISAPVQAEAIINLDDVIGEIDPRIYGHSLTYQERCLYGGLYSDDGTQVNEDVLKLIKALKPPIIRIPDNPNYDQSDHAHKPNQIGIDELLTFCHQVGAEPYLVINDSPNANVEIGRLLADSKALLKKIQGITHESEDFLSANSVKLWGLSRDNQDGEPELPENALAYANELQQLISAMRSIDPAIDIVATGSALLESDPYNGETWNRTILKALGDQINYFSFQLFHPGETGFQEYYDPEKLYHSIVAAPHSAEDVINRMAAQIQEIAPDFKIALALDAYNVKLPPPPTSTSPQDLTYRLRDGLYVAGMLNVFHRQCNSLKIANITHLVNALPMITKPNHGAAFPTPLYFPFKLYQMMEKQVLEVGLWSPFFKSEPLGQTISRKDEVPYIDITATRSGDASRLGLSILNLHPHKSAKVTLNLKSESSNSQYRIHQAWEMSGPDPLAANTADVPDRVNIRQIKAPKLKFGWLDAVLPPASLVVLTLEY